MQEWRFDQLEQSVPESTWLEAEALVDSQAIANYTHDNKVFNAVIQSGANQYHCSAQLKSKNSLSRAKCSCSAFSEKKYCPHWIAFAVYIRNQLLHDKSKDVNQKFDLETIGTEVPFSTLWTFIRNYAKKDKELEWNLKARFARKVSVQDDLKYKKLLDQILPPSQATSTRKPHKKLKQIQQIIATLKDEALDALTMDEYKETFLIIEACLPKLCILLRDQEPLMPETLESFNFFIQLTRDLHQEKIPVHLREDLESFCLDLSCRSYFPNKRQHDTLYGDLANWLAEKNDSTKLALQALNAKFGFTLKADQHIAFLAQSHILYQTLDPENNNFQQHLNRLKSHLENAQKLLHFAHYHLIPEHAAKLYLAMIRVWSKTSVEKQIFDHMEAAFAGMSDSSSKLYWAEILLQHRFVPACYDLLSKHSAIIDFYEWMEQHIGSNMDPQEFTVYLGNYYAYTEQWDKLKELITSIESATLLRNFDRIIFMKKPDLGVELYSQFVNGYLTDHHGPAASKFISTVKSRLQELDAYEHWKTIAKMTLEQYGDRNSVIAGIYEL